MKVTGNEEMRRKGEKGSQMDKMKKKGRNREKEENKRKT